MSLEGFTGRTVLWRGGCLLVINGTPCCPQGGEWWIVQNWPVPMGQSPDLLYCWNSRPSAKHSEVSPSLSMDGEAEVSSS